MAGVLIQKKIPAITPNFLSIIARLPYPITDNGVAEERGGCMAFSVA